MQDDLGFSALGTGLRILFLSLAVFVTAGVAGRLTCVGPVRLIICAGFVLVTAGLLLMRGLTAGSGWPHLIPGDDRGGSRGRAGQRAARLDAAEPVTP